MGAEDWAIVVGVNNYPGLSDLNGPAGDAADFFAWVTSKTKGDVPIDPAVKNFDAATKTYTPLQPNHQAKLIRSTDFVPPNFASTSVAKPTEAEIHQAFDELKDIHDANKKAGLGSRIGRRLYLYFAGHGFAPSYEDAAILMANADSDARLGYHIAGKPWAQWFFISGCFDEVVLFMDCCRDNYTSIGINAVKYKAITGPRPIDDSKLFLGFGTKWNRKSWEREISPGKWRGVFTSALLDGLGGIAADPVTGQITARTLGSFLYDNMRNYLSPSDISDPDVEKTPFLRYDSNDGDNLVFIDRVPVPGFPVRIEIPARLRGFDILIAGGGSDQKITPAADADTHELRMPRGIYRATIDSDKVLFEVVGSTKSNNEPEVTNVKFV